MSVAKLLKPGPTLFILVCFFASATLRVGTDGWAVAQELSDGREDTEAEVTPETVRADPEVSVLLEMIYTRQEQLSKREIEISERQLLLNEVEARVEAQLELLEKTGRKLAETLTIAKSAAEDDLLQLTEVYQKMKPQNAAEIFDTMEVSFAAGFLARMRPESAAGILSEMPPETAYSISVVMAGRNANAPKE